MRTNWISNVMIPSIVALSLFAVGCGQPAAESGDDKKPGASTDTKGGDHSGWWCVEHAIPEEVCSMCSAKAADDFKAKGDWCEEHNRAKSQCFKCDPSQAEKYAKLYKAKFDEAPPKPIE